MLRNPSLEDLKSDLIKFQKEEDLKPVEPLSSERECWRPSKSNEKDEDKPNAENIFISMLHIGLVQNLKVDAQSADWLLKKMSKSMEKRQVQQQHAASNFCTAERQLGRTGFAVRHAIEIEKIL